MAVTIVTMRDGYGRASSVDIVETGTYFHVSEAGHLVVEDGGGVQAVYMSGKWVSAFKDAGTKIAEELS